MGEIEQILQECLQSNTDQAKVIKQHYLGKLPEKKEKTDGIRPLENCHLDFMRGYNKAIDDVRGVIDE